MRQVNEVSTNINDQDQAPLQLEIVRRLSKDA